MIRHTSFTSGKGALEHFFSGCAEHGSSFTDEANALLNEYQRLLIAAGCSVETEFLLRFHLSDITNQAPQLRSLLNNRDSFISMIGQPPADGSRIALEAWHMNSMNKNKLDDHTYKFSFENYTAILSEGKNSEKIGSFDQTAEEFEELEQILQQNSASISDNTVRTWLYCRDVDNNYAGLVKARNQYFSKIGLTKDTHFIASTGIEGISEKPSRLVTMDSLSYPCISQKQLIYLSATDMLSPTAIYGVSFERGSRLVFGDRSHYFISGTASIDKFGKTLYENDVRAQTVRILDNIDALLRSSAGSLSDIVMATVYLRDPADMSVVQEIISDRLGCCGLPLIYLKAPVCRPAWLVEMEAIAVNAKGNSEFQFFG